MNLFRRSANQMTMETAGPSVSTASFLAIFDFDCTLTTFHVWGRVKNAPLSDIGIDESTFVDLVGLS